MIGRVLLQAVHALRGGHQRYIVHYTKDETKTPPHCRRHCEPMVNLCMRSLAGEAISYYLGFEI